MAVILITVWRNILAGSFKFREWRQFSYKTQTQSRHRHLTPTTQSTAVRSESNSTCFNRVSVVLVVRQKNCGKIKRFLELSVPQINIGNVARVHTSAASAIMFKHDVYHIVAYSKFSNLTRTSRPLLVLPLCASQMQKAKQMYQCLVNRMYVQERLHLGKDGDWSIACSCCGLNKRGDQVLSEFLKQMRSRSAPSVTQLRFTDVGQFLLTGSNGTTVNLMRLFHNELVLVKLQLKQLRTDDVSSDEEDEEYHREQNADILLFTVHINKGGDTTLGIRCRALPTYDISAELIGYSLEIQQLAMLQRGQRWDTNVFVIPSTLMAMNLQNLLCHYLAERGIDNEFLDRLVDFNTAYTHKQYCCFLEELSDFFGCAVKS